MSTSYPERVALRWRPIEAPRSVRWRLWGAMLALALVPTAAGIYLTASLLGQVEPVPQLERAHQTSEAAAGLLATEQAIESRLLVAAGNTAMGTLADGVRGASERQTAARVLEGLRGSDGAVVSGACIVRSGDGRSIPLGSDRGAERFDACADALLRGQALSATADTVTHARSDGGRLLLAAPLRSVSGRDGGVLSVEVDVPALFDRGRSSSADAVASMIVDMGSSEVIARSPMTADPAAGAERHLESLTRHVGGIVAGDAETGHQLAAMGLAPSLLPLWGNGDGSRMALLQVWPSPSVPIPSQLRLAFVILLASAILAVVLLARYFLNPFEELADSRTELQVLYHEAREDALADGLTGLGNHRAFQEELARQISAFDERGTAFSVVLLDLDDLKVVNDREGHAAGDETLRLMARTMREQGRDNDLLFRTGGDEFAMLLPGADIEDATGVAERILHFCKRPHEGARSCAFSGGISGVPWFTRHGGLVYQQADAALYWAKRHGRGLIEVFDADRDHLPDEYNAVTGNAVAEVITGKLLSPVFQPIVDLRSGRILGFEGLIRPDPNGPLPNTERLFAAAAASGRTVELDLACIEVVVNGARAIGPDRLLTLNLSPRTLEVKDFDAAWLLKSLVRNGISPSRVIIELTEREEVDDLVRLRRTFATLQQYGLRLAADDVGAGNAGLRLLSQVQFDIVKIDLSLVQDGVRRLGSRAVLQSLRDLALSQDARIVAEGVETVQQLRVIRELDIGAGQGFLLGRPEVSVAKTFVDVRQLASGLVVPAHIAPGATSVEPAASEGSGDLDDISAERRAIFLPPAARGFLRPEPGGA